MPQIAVKLSSDCFSRLKRLAWQGETTYAKIIESALAAYQPEASPVSETNKLRELIDAAMQPVLARLAMLESMGLVKHPHHPTSISVQVAQEAPEMAIEAQGIAKAGHEQEGAQIAAQGVVGDADEPANAFPSILSPPNLQATRPTVKEKIAELIASGMRSPAQIARALNAAGYHTQALTEFSRSNPQITGALKVVEK